MHTDEERKAAEGCPQISQMNADLILNSETIKPGIERRRGGLAGYRYLGAGTWERQSDEEISAGVEAALGKRRSRSPSWLPGFRIQSPVFLAIHLVKPKQAERWL
jgi:hypothetical protein